MNNNLLSIVVLNYRRLKYSKQTIGCILNKTTVPHELILVDNSVPEKDNSQLAIDVRSYLDSVVGNKYTKNIIKVYNDKNLGVAGGRNSGLVKASGDYLMTIDDDVLLPDNYDKLLIEACDKIPKLGITGVNVEPTKYQVVNMNGTNVRPKSIGNLGGACLCLPRRVFDRVGYYKVYGQYGLEDSDMYVRLNKLGLMSAYIEPRGTHLDNDAEKAYRHSKNRAHRKGSSQLKAFSMAKIGYEKTGNVYVPFIPYDPDDIKWAEFERLDGTLEAKDDIRKILDSMEQTKNMRIGNVNEIGIPINLTCKLNINSSIKIISDYIELKQCYINTAAERRDISDDTALRLIEVFCKNNISCLIREFCGKK